MDVDLGNPNTAGPGWLSLGANDKAISENFTYFHNDQKNLRNSKYFLQGL